MPDSMNLLALIVALSAYLAAIRFFAQERLASIPRPSNERALKVLLFRIVFADAPLVVAGVHRRGNCSRRRSGRTPAKPNLGGSPSSFASRSPCWQFTTSCRGARVSRSTGSFRWHRAVAPHQALHLTRGVALVSGRTKGSC